MTDRVEGAWRDEEKLPLAELNKAMASWDNDGQGGDQTGNDAGAELAFGGVAPERDPDRDDPDRALRPSTTPHTDPH